MSVEYRFDVHGTAVPQGSKKAFVVKGRAVIVDVKSEQLKAWRAKVAATAAEAGGGVCIDEAVEVRVMFGIERAASVTREWPSVAPDVDKLARAVLDGLTDSGLIRDDSRVVRLVAEKVYAARPGARVVVAVRGREEQE